MPVTVPFGCKWLMHDLTFFRSRLVDETGSFLLGNKCIRHHVTCEKLAIMAECPFSGHHRSFNNHHHQQRKAVSNRETDREEAAAATSVNMPSGHNLVKKQHWKSYTTQKHFWHKSRVCHCFTNLTDLHRHGVKSLGRRHPADRMRGDGQNYLPGKTAILPPLTIYYHNRSMKLGWIFVIWN